MTLADLACAPARWFVAVFAHPFVVVLLLALSCWSAIWAAVAWTSLAAGVFLSILALALSSAIMMQQRVERVEDQRRDDAMHAKLDSLVHGVPEADDALIGAERDAA